MWWEDASWKIFTNTQAKNRLYHAALNVRFTPHEVSILNLRTAEATEDREVIGDLPQVQVSRISVVGLSFLAKFSSSVAVSR